MKHKNIKYDMINLWSDSMSKIILIEGTDCSGKETQANLLLERLNKDFFKSEKLGFPMYDTPTGKIIGGPYLGKPHIMEGWFKEGAVNVDPKVASLYFAADRLYNVNKIYNLLNNNINVILDRYVESNMGHQGGKLTNHNERLKMYYWLENLEYKTLGLPVPNIKILLYMPYQYAYILRQNRNELADEHESSREHLINAEKAYLEIAGLFHFDIVNCIKDNQIRSIDDIHEEVYEIVRKKIK